MEQVRSVHWADHADRVTGKLRGHRM